MKFMTAIALLMSISAVQAASNSHKGIEPNDDGTSTIIEPFFSAADGSARWISGTSDMDGVCRLYGFSSSVAGSSVLEGDYDRTVVINSTGKFGGFYLFNRQNYNNRISSLACTNGYAPTAPSTHASRILANDDGSVTIVEPWFAKTGGESLYLSATSDLDGVCRLFGKGRYVANSKLGSGDYQRTVIVGGDSKFAGFYKFNRQSYNNRIDSLICESN
jgi:hypothetical protein